MHESKTNKINAAGAGDTKAQRPYRCTDRGCKLCACVMSCQSQAQGLHGAVLVAVCLAAVDWRHSKLRS